MYKTGDIVTINKDGNMVFCERADYQVKYNGYRINLGEIEVAISKYTKIPNVIALIKNENNHMSLCAFIETSNDIDILELKRSLKKFLPHYMIPKEIVLLSKFPSTPNGKIDRNALLNLKIAKNENKNFVKPRNELDTKIYNAWKSVLKHENFGIDDNIFDIGGDSLSIISIQSILFKEDIKVRSQELFENPTIRAISDKIVSNENKIFNKDIKFERLYKDDISNIKKLDASFKNVLLTGATGFLGAHILAQILNTSSDVNVYCVIRSKPNKTCTERLKEIMHYYFGEKYDMLYNNKIFIVEGDLSRDNLGMDITTYKNLLSKIDVIINKCYFSKFNYKKYILSNLTNL